MPLHGHSTTTQTSLNTYFTKIYLCLCALFSLDACLPAWHRFSRGQLWGQLSRCQVGLCLFKSWHPTTNYIREKLAPYEKLYSKHWPLTTNYIRNVGPLRKTILEKLAPRLGYWPWVPVFAQKLFGRVGPSARILALGASVRPEMIWKS